MKVIHLNVPITNENDILNIHTGDIVYISGYIYTGRDAAHKRLCDLINDKKDLPISLNNETIYYVGPSPARPGEVIGSAGPTSSYRMDSYSGMLMEKGLKIMIGKGPRSKEYKEELKEHKAIYLSCIGGSACLISKCIKKAEVVAYEDLGTEAIYRFKVENMYTICTYDSYGNDLFKEGIEKFRGKNK